MQRLVQLIATGTQPQVQNVVLKGIGSGLLLADHAARSRERGIPCRQDDQQLPETAQETALSRSAPVADRLAAIELLGLDRFEGVQETLVTLLDPREPQEIQSRAVQMLSGFRNLEVADLLLAKYPTLTPAIRQEVIEAMLSGRGRVEPLFDAIDKGIVSSAPITPTRRRFLQSNRNTEIRERAQKLFSGDSSSPRATVIADYQKALQMDSDPHAAS